MMETTELIRHLEHEYWSILAANPEWDKSLVQFLLDKRVAADDIYAAFPEEAAKAGLDEPAWY